MESRDGEGRAEERLAWLAEMCRLSPLAVDLFKMIAGAEPDAAPVWWTVSAVAARLHADDLGIIAELVPGAPLIDWGLVRMTPAPTSRSPGEARVAVNERIARFLWARLVRPAEYRSVQ